MQDDVEIKQLIKKATETLRADDALKFSQAALNIAHALQIARYTSQNRRFHFLPGL